MQSCMMQYRGQSPGSNLLVVSQQGTESCGGLSPVGQSSKKTHNMTDMEWPLLNSVHASFPRNLPPINSALAEKVNSVGKSGGKKSTSYAKQKRGEQTGTEAGGSEKQGPHLAEIPLIDSFEADEIVEILDGILSNTAPMDNFAGIKESEIVDIDSRF
ncbi:hypothetical protein R1sor_008902 [Riccia sorocarpa]|uniref:Uncharacterized protein n=1 Tax=Riccia sorocarpa TaxID=122646 RepID=A0ABD3H489_9MARC